MNMKKIKLFLFILIILLVMSTEATMATKNKSGVLGSGGSNKGGKPLSSSASHSNNKHRGSDKPEKDINKRPADYKPPKDLSDREDIYDVEVEGGMTEEESWLEEMMNGRDGDKPSDGETATHDETKTKKRMARHSASKEDKGLSRRSPFTTGGYGRGFGSSYGSGGGFGGGGGGVRNNAPAWWNEYLRLNNWNIG